MQRGAPTMQLLGGVKRFTIPLPGPRFTLLVPREREFFIDNLLIRIH